MERLAKQQPKTDTQRRRDKFKLYFQGFPRKST